MVKIISGFLTSISNGNYQLGGLVFSIFVVFALSWYAWICTQKPKEIPPLPPGPRGLPVVGNLLSLDQELHSYFAGLAQIHGPVLKLWFGNKLGIVVSSPSLSQEVLRDHDVTFANRDVPACGLLASYGGSDIVSAPYGQEWRMLRKVCVLKMLSHRTLNSVYTLRRKQVRQTVGYFYGGVGCPVNVGERLFLMVLNVVTDMLWGESVEGNEKATLGAEFREVVSEMTELLGKPDLSDFYPALARFDLQGITRRMGRLARRLDRIFDVVIDQRMNIRRDIRSTTAGNVSGDESKDFLQFLLKLKDEGDPNTPLTITHLKALLMDMVVGGSETSSNTVEFAMAEIMNKPEVMRKAQEELEVVVGNNNIVEESTVHKLPYLQAVMKETLRLHPVLPLLVPHCPGEACTVGGYTIPKGCRVFVNVWAIQRDPSVWENPLNFDPERFLNGQWDYSGRDFRYFPFGSGRRMCAGTAMAERMVMYSLATLLHSFNWKLPNGEKLDLAERFGIVLKKKTPLVAIPTPRLPNPSLYQ